MAADDFKTVFAAESDSDHSDDIKHNTSEDSKELLRFRDEWTKELIVSTNYTHSVEKEKTFKVAGFGIQNSLSVDEELHGKSVSNCSLNNEPFKTSCSSKQDVKYCPSKDVILLDLPNPDTKQNTGNKPWKKQKLCNKDVDAENFLELLIADIDEITVIPFFDLQLPREIGLKIFHFLGIKDLCYCASVSKSWRNLADDELLWFNFGVVLGFVPMNTTVSEKSDWKGFVRECINERRQLEGRWKERICKVDVMEYERGTKKCGFFFGRKGRCPG